jgi:hypothetical protein
VRIVRLTRGHRLRWASVVFGSDLATHHGRGESGEHSLVPARGFEATRLVVVTLGGGEADMAEYKMGIAELMGRQADAEGAGRLYANAPRQCAKLKVRADLAQVQDTCLCRDRHKHVWTKPTDQIARPMS